ncbi:MAG: molybdopterin-dependent oxidoreductase [Coriobacteriales bacterium]|jgi:anaerobic dimethyl sulfoxide reductase subunit A|nr:molybdopterin-dependent oxidoreductase [Coriobacteriales bacterium]
MGQEKTLTTALDRRTFISGCAAATAALAGMSLVGCNDNKLDEVPSVAERPVLPPGEEGAEWFAIPCWHNCGGRCLNKVLLKDGVVLRQKTDDTHEDSYDWPQARACPRGRAQQQQVFGADRIKYPMKRKNWSPDNPNGQLRGIDEWERISWDEALDIVASELKKAKEKYGNESILYFNIVLLEGFMGPLLAKFGGFTDTTSIDSLGTYQLNTNMYGVPSNQVNDRYDMLNADYVVLYGHNSAWCTASSTYYLKAAHDKGIKFAFVGPEYNVTASFVDAKWYPVRQGTDSAFLLGVAHSMLQQDDNGSIIDWDFLNRCTVGFDADHAPADATTNENFRDYVKGVYDGIEKTPEWASEICGCPVELINDYALMMCCKNKVSLYSNWAPARNKGAENLPQLSMTIGAMGGHFGTPGNCNNCAGATNAFDNGPVLVMGGYAGYVYFFNTAALNNPVTNWIPNNELWSAILTGKYHDSGNVHYGFREQEEREVDIHVIISEQHNRLQTCEGMTKGIEAFRKVDFVCSQAYWMKTDTRYADVVLPITTRWEEQMFSGYMSFSTFRDLAYGYEKAIDPLFEARSDLEIVYDLAERLDVDVSEFLSIDNTQGWFNSMAGAQILSNSANAVNSGATNEAEGEREGESGYQPLITITQEDIDKYGVIGTPQEGVISLEEFVKTGVYRVKRSAEDAGAFIFLEDFRKDPEANPIETKSGKLEIYCQTKSDYLDMANRLTPNYTPVSPLPKILPTVEGYIESFVNWETKEVGPYPYQVSNSHYLRRAHSDIDNVPWLREVWPNPVFISKKDAQDKGIVSGDVIRIWNDNGQVLRPASVTRCIMPGTLELPHGAAVMIDPETGIDLAGADNMLTSPNKATCVTSNGWNSTLVNFEKYAGNIELSPDCDWEPIIPIAE